MTRDLWWLLSTTLLLAPLAHAQDEPPTDDEEASATADPERTFLLIERLHRILLAISILTVLGAVAGSHGMVF